MNKYAVTVMLKNDYWAVQLLVDADTPVDAIAQTDAKLLEAQSVYKFDTSRLIVTQATDLKETL